MPNSLVKGYWTSVQFIAHNEDDEQLSWDRRRRTPGNSSYFQQRTHCEYRQGNLEEAQYSPLFLIMSHFVSRNGLKVWRYNPRDRRRCS